MRFWLSALAPLVMAWLFILVAFLIPMLDSTREPYFDLTRPFSQLAYWVSRTGGKYGVPIVAASMIALLVTRRGIPSQRRWKETGYSFPSGHAFSSMFFAELPDGQ